LREAADDTHIARANISDNIKNNCRTAGGFIWMYKEEYEQTLNNI
jgi:hypothetical protein